MAHSGRTRFLRQLTQERFDQELLMGAEHPKGWGRAASPTAGPPSPLPSPGHSPRQVRHSPECELSASVPFRDVSSLEASMMYQKSVAMATTRKTKLETPTSASRRDRRPRLALISPPPRPDPPAPAGEKPRPTAARPAPLRPAAPAPPC